MFQEKSNVNSELKAEEKCDLLKDVQQKLTELNINTVMLTEYNGDFIANMPALYAVLNVPALNKHITKETIHDGYSCVKIVQYQNTENNPRLKITMSSWQNHLHQDMALSTVSTSVIDKLEQVLHVIHPYLD